jgi:hypothetical protein
MNVSFPIGKLTLANGWQPPAPIKGSHRHVMHLAWHTELKRQ